MQMAGHDSKLDIEAFFFIHATRCFMKFCEKYRILVFFINFQPGVCVAIYALFSKFMLRKNLGDYVYLENK